MSSRPWGCIFYLILYNYCIVFYQNGGEKIGLSMKLVNQTTGKDLDPNNVQSSWVSLLYYKTYRFILRLLSILCYRPQTKFAKVMFLQVCVCPQGGGRAWHVVGRVCVAGGHAWLGGGGMRGRGVCMARGCMAGGCAWQGGVCMAGRVCVAGGGVHGRGVGACVAGGACVAEGGGGMAGGVRATADTMGYGQWAGGTHPTGMHSCFVLHLE